MVNKRPIIRPGRPFCACKRVFSDKFSPERGYILIITGVKLYLNLITHYVRLIRLMKRSTFGLGIT